MALFRNTLTDVLSGKIVEPPKVDLSTEGIQVVLANMEWDELDLSREDFHCVLYGDEEISTESLDEFYGDPLRPGNPGSAPVGQPPMGGMPAPSTVFGFSSTGQPGKIDRCHIHLATNQVNLDRLIPVLTQMNEDAEVHVFYYSSIPLHVASACNSLLSLTKAKVVSHILTITTPVVLEMALSANEVVMSNTSVLYISHEDEGETRGATITDALNNANFTLHQQNRALNNLQIRGILNESDVQKFRAQDKILVLQGDKLKTKLDNARLGPLE